MVMYKKNIIKKLLALAIVISTLLLPKAAQAAMTKGRPATTEELRVVLPAQLQAFPIGLLPIITSYLHCAKTVNLREDVTEVFNEFIKRPEHAGLTMLAELPKVYLAARPRPENTTYTYTKAGGRTFKTKIILPFSTQKPLLIECKPSSPFSKSTLLYTYDHDNATLTLDKDGTLAAANNTIREWTTSRSESSSTSEPNLSVELDNNTGLVVMQRYSNNNQLIYWIDDSTLADAAAAQLPAVSSSLSESSSSSSSNSSALDERKA